MWYNFKVECQRYFNEMMSFKFNLFFANIGLILFFNGLLKYSNVQNKESVLILLFFWYFATHGFINIDYIIEEEIMDNTFAHVMMTGTSFLEVIFLRSIIQVFYDFIKAIVVFGIVIYFGNYDFSWINMQNGLVIVILLVIGILISYFIGLIIGSLTLKYKKISALPNLLYYYVLFFGGILYSYSNFKLLNWIYYLLPFLPIKNITYALQRNIMIDYNNFIVLAVQFIVYLLLGLFFYNKYSKDMLKKGSVFYV